MRRGRAVEKTLRRADVPAVTPQVSFYLARQTQVTKSARNYAVYFCF